MYDQARSLISMEAPSATYIYHDLRLVADSSIEAAGRLPEMDTGMKCENMQMKHVPAAQAPAATTKPSSPPLPTPPAEAPTTIVQLATQASTGTQAQTSVDVTPLPPYPSLSLILGGFGRRC
jgi:hypothetical protein